MEATLQKLKELEKKKKDFSLIPIGDDQNEINFAHKILSKINKKIKKLRTLLNFN